MSFLSRYSRKPSAARTRERSLHIVIFSKDRACQLDSLLRSIRHNLHLPSSDITILWRASDRAFARGYEHLHTHQPAAGVRWVEERNFPDDLRRLVATFHPDSLVMFLVDDDIFFRRFDDTNILRALSPRHLFISLRCSRAYRRDTPPVFTMVEPWLEWKWNYSKKNVVSWNYPFSVDGNIVRTSVIRRILRAIEFSAPNSLEGRMHRHRHAWWVKRRSRALAPCRAVVVNNPLNRVQIEGETDHQDVSATSLNERFLEGYRIDNGVYYTMSPKGVHHPVAVRFHTPGNTPDA
jgi:hypothetical protein